MGIRIRGFAVALLLVAATASAEEPAKPPAAPATPAKTPNEVARRFLDAFRAKDEPAMRACLERPGPDPFRIADVLFDWFVQGTLDGKPEMTVSLDAARDLARFADAERVGAGLPALVEAWAAMGREGYERERRLRRINPRIEEARKAKDRAAVLAYFEDIGADLRDHRSSLQPVFLLYKKSDVLREYGERAKSLECIADATRRARDLGSREALGGMLTLHAAVQRDLGNFDAAIALREEAVREWERYGDAAKLNSARFNLGTTYGYAGEYVKALEWSARARDGLEAAGNRGEVATALDNEGQWLTSLGRFEEALRSLDRARAEYRSLGNHAREAAVSVSFAQLLARQGRYAEALNELEPVLRVLREAGDRKTTARTLQAFGVIYRAMGMNEKAIEALRASVTESEAVGDRNLAAWARVVLADAIGAAGNPSEAAAMLERAVADALALGSRPLALAARVSLAQTRIRMGQFQPALEAYGKAAEDAEATGELLAVLASRVGVGKCLGRLGRHEESLDVLGKALAACEAAGAVKSLAFGHLYRAAEQLQAGAFAAAAADAGRGLETFARMNRAFGEEEASGLRRDFRSCAEVGLEACLGLQGAGSGKDGPVWERAVWFLEISRAFLLAEGLLNQRSLLAERVPAELLREDGEAAAAVAAAHSRLLRIASAKGPDPKELEAARRDLDAAYSRAESVRATVGRAARRTVDAVQPVPATLGALQAALGPGTALVEYQIGFADNRQGIAVVVTRDRVGIVDLGASVPLKERAEAWLRLLSTQGAGEEASSAASYDAFLRPLESLLEGCTRLLVSPDGALSFVPFEALLRRGKESEERAVEKWEISYVPSGTVLLQVAAEARGGEKGRGIVALGDPRYPSEVEAAGMVAARTRDLELRGLASVQRLEASAEEVRAVAALFPEEERTLLLREGATPTALKEVLARRSGRLAAVHIACHGLVDAERPRLTGLVLAGGEVLTLDDVYRMQVPADLVVLSACETGRGKVLHGEGVYGLVRGFLYAGCPRVVVSYWKVADRGTRDLMESFYRKMRVDGLAPGAALRAAKLERIRKGGPDAQPHHWAAFVLWGTTE